ncbi:MAG: hypothetical protein Fur003_2120 [Candidatus Dojkabacteria bacterium]
MNVNKKLLFISRNYKPTFGGMEDLAYGIATSLAKLVPFKMIVNRGSYKALPVFAIKVFIYTLLFGWKYDIIYCNDMLTCFFALPSKIIYKKPITTTIYGLDINYIFQEPINAKTRIAKYIYKNIIRFIIKHIDNFIPISKGTKELGAKLGINSLDVITPGIDTTSYKYNANTRSELRNKISSEYKVDKSKVWLFAMGRLVKRKGVAWFIKNVMPLINDKAILFIGGGGEDELLIKELSQPYKEKIFVLGRIPDQLRNDLYLASDFFIMPNIKVESDWEGFGIVSIEASLNGTPVLAANVD